MALFAYILRPKIQYFDAFRFFKTKENKKGSFKRSYKCTYLTKVTNLSFEICRHGSQEPKKFSWLGVKIAYDHFRSSGHRHITLIVPHFKRHKTTDAEDLKIIRLFEDHDVIKYTQSRVPQASVHDDRMMLELAEKVGGVIVSNDKFSDVARDKAEWKRISRDFVCTFIFVKDV